MTYTLHQGAGDDLAEAATSNLYRHVKAEKEFDAVKFMRKRREEISKEFAEMTYAEKRAYLDKHVKLRSDRTPDRSPKKAG